MGDGENHIVKNKIDRHKTNQQKVKEKDIIVRMEKQENCVTHQNKHSVIALLIKANTYQS